jgi:biopolymer transport protein ExbD
MPIYAPGRRDRHNRRSGGKKRSAIAMLSLTAMVDMFTVLAVFLLQNYQTTGEVIEISDNVQLPQARAVKEIKPAHVIVISKERLMLDKTPIITFSQLQGQEDWKIEKLHTLLVEAFKKADEKRKMMGLENLKNAVDKTGAQEKAEDARRVTVQADKNVDFLTIKKVLYTLSEVGAGEINFAVIKDEKKKN